MGSPSGFLHLHKPPTDVDERQPLSERLRADTDEEGAEQSCGSDVALAEEAQDNPSQRLAIHTAGVMRMGQLTATRGSGVKGAFNGDASEKVSQ